MKRPKLLMGVVVSVLFLGICVWAQVTTGTISGTVSDPTGAVIPGTNVSIRNVDTGISRAVSADEAGRYVAPQLPIGNYEVTVEAAGFQTVVRSGITLTVGREAVLNFSLQVGAVGERITVTGEAPLIETTSSTVTGLVNETQMKDLPLNARSFEQLAFLQPNVYYQRHFISTTNTGYTPRISAAGMRTTYNSYVVDGIDITDVTSNTPGSVAGQLLGVETLREFRVLSNNYPAQYGRGLGAVMDVASRSGTNELHGTLFEFLRNNKLDARNFFDPAQVRPFRRNQFGGVVGGPIKRDKIFFFGSYEALRERLTTSNVVTVPTAQAKQGILPDPARPGQTITVPVHPDIKPLLALYPLPQTDLGGGVGSYTFPFSAKTGENFYTGRGDYQRSENTSYFGRWTGDSTNMVQPRGLGVIPPWAQGLTSWNQTATVAETRLLSPQLINEFRVGFVRSTPRTTSVLTGPDPQIHFPGTIGQGIIGMGTTFAGGAGTLAVLGSVGRAFENYTGNTFQVVDNVSYVIGPHTFKMGLNLERFHDNVGNLTETGLYEFSSSYTFQSLPDVLAGTALSFSGVLTPSASGISGRQWLYGFYLQDDYRLRSNFTLNLGLRYETPSNYSNKHRRFLVLNDLFQNVKTGQEFAWGGAPCKGCIEPRFGWAWDVFSNGKTAIRGGFGMFHAQITRFRSYFPTTWGSTGGSSIGVDYPSFPDPRVTGPNSVIRITIEGTGNTGARMTPVIPSTPTALHYNLALEQQLGPNTTFRAAFVGSRAYHIEGGYEKNTRVREMLPGGIPYYPPTNKRYRPDFGSVVYSPNDFNSNYNALTLTLGQRMSHGMAFEASYAFSRATDDTTLAGTTGAYQTNEPALLDDRRNVSHGLSGLDMRHRFVANASYDFPALPIQNAFAKKVFSGWQVNSIITLQAGVPLTPLIGLDWAQMLGTYTTASQRPSFNPAVKPEVPVCPCQQMPASLGGGTQGRPQRYFDPTVFVLPERYTLGGNVGRGILTGPGLVNFDFALVKNTTITERLNLQFRAEGYNMFNTVNWANPVMNLFQSSGAISPAAGRITSTSTTSRQMQLALKLLF